MSQQQRSTPVAGTSPVAPPPGEVLDNVAQALAGLRFGSIEIVVHEGKVTQIERKEKFRL